MKRNILAVASGKGGVGKTWLSITLAHALARAGSRALLFDGGLGLANVDVQLGITSERNLGGVIGGQIRLREAVSRYGGGFDIVAGRTGPGNLAMLPLNRLLGLHVELQELGQDYDWVVLDLGARAERTVRLLAAQSRACLVITTDEPTAITDAYAFIKISAMEKLADNIQVVVNMAATHREGERTYQTLSRACREFLKLEPKLAGVVRRDERVKDAISAQTSLLTRHPTSEAAADAEAIARRLVETL